MTRLTIRSAIRQEFGSRGNAATAAEFQKSSAHHTTRAAEDMAGSMRRKRRKKLKTAWEEFGIKHHLTEESIKLARGCALSVEQLEKALVEMDVPATTSMSQRVRRFRSRIDEERKRKEEQRADAPDKRPTKKTQKRKPNNPLWAKAKKICRLNQADIQMAKELGMSPKSLMRNVPPPTQQWKIPVKDWIRELHAERFD